MASSSHDHEGNMGKTASSRLLSAAQDSGRPEREREREETSWRAPAVILIPLALGAGLALAHHFLNSYLNGRAVDSVRLSQTWTSRVGTAFAFLVKMMFTISVGTAYVQRQWLRFRSHSFRVKDIDSLTNVLGNALVFFTSGVFLRHPILCLMALVSWAIPLAAVVAPASLTAHPAPILSIVPQQVPRPYYNQTNFATGQVFGDVIIVGVNDVYKLAYNTASAGQPVALQSQFQNATYTVAFNSAAVQCQPAVDKALIRNLSIWTFGSGIDYQFLSFLPSAIPVNITELLEDSSFVDTLDTTSSDATKIYVMTNTGTWNKTLSANISGLLYEGTQVNITECLLYNATYEVDFSFQYPNQTSQVSITHWLNPVAAFELFTANFDTDNATVAELISYSSIMQAFGKLLVGFVQSDQYNGPVPMYTSQPIISIDWTESEHVERGLESLFQNLTLSLLSNEPFIQNSSLAAFVDVHVTTWPNTYVYDAFDLLLAYGVAFACAVVCAAVGLHAFVANHASYQNLFSSFLRAASDEERALLRGSGDGADPLPAEQAKLRIMMGGEGEEGNR